MTSLAEQRNNIQNFLKYSPTDRPIDFEVIETVQESGYSRLRIAYASNEGDMIPAFLLLPDGDAVCPAVLVPHQHNGERYLGKSEVVGLVGDPLQNFGDALAKRGFIVLAPDSICFEDRRRHMSGVEAHPYDDQQHYDEMCFRLAQGDFLMRKVLDDASVGLSLLLHHPRVDNSRVGTLGHSYGGTVTLFHAAVDERVQFVCTSGALCSYAYKFEHNLSLAMCLAIPDFTTHWDYEHLVACIAPHPLLVVSADEDKHAQDADIVLEKAKHAYEGSDALVHHRYQGGHPLTQERFDRIVAWVENNPSP